MTTVRLAGLKDLPALVPLFDGYRQFYGRPSQPDVAQTFLADRLSRNESVIFIALAPSGAAVGFTQLYPMFSSLSAGRAFILNDLFVAPEARRMGVASALLEKAERYAADVGAAGLSLSTEHRNHAAIKLYESRGWTRDDKFRWYQFEIEGKPDAAGDAPRPEGSGQEGDR